MVYNMTDSYPWLHRQIRLWLDLFLPFVFHCTHYCVFEHSILFQDATADFCGYVPANIHMSELSCKLSNKLAGNREDQGHELATLDT